MEKKPNTEKCTLTSQCEFLKYMGRLLLDVEIKLIFVYQDNLTTTSSSLSDLKKTQSVHVSNQAVKTAMGFLVWGFQG